MKDEVQQLKLENDKLRERREELEIKLEAYLEGEDTLLGGKILHQAVNPLAESLEQRGKLVEKLQQDIERLKRKIKNYEDGIENSKLGDITMNFKEVNLLKEKLKSQEAQAQMMKDHFKSQVDDFRNDINELLGYKIDRTQGSLYMLRSIYAERPDDALCFQVDSNGSLNLMKNAFSETLESLIDLHLMHQKSIPVFLSALTMDLFNNKSVTITE